MNILMLNYEYPPLGGGAGQATLNICRQISQHHHVTVVTTWFEGLSEMEEDGNLCIIRLKCLRKQVFRSNPREMFSWMRHCLRYCDTLLMNQDMDIIFAHFAIPGGEVSYRLGKRFNIPYVIMSHGHDIPWFFPGQMFFYHLILYQRIKLICKHSVKNFMLTPEMKLNADRFLGKKLSNKNIIIPNACDTLFFPHIRQRDTQILRMIFVGRFVNQKQPLQIIHALHILRQRKIAYEFVFAGNGPLLPKMQSLIKLYGLSDAVYIKGWLSLDAVREEYAKAHLMLMPSKAEGMSVAIIEALVSGVFVVCSKAANSYSMIEHGENGYVIESVNPEPIADSIELYYHKFFMTARAVSDEAVDKIAGFYNWQNIGERYIEELKSRQ